jgi:DNA polymerase IV
VARSGAGERRILLADADAFYVSVARLVDPEGAGKAPFLIVGGTAQGRGVVTSASYEARQFGVTSAMPTARALRLCPQATVVPVSWQACAAKSRQIREVMGQFTPVVEAASQDEFYLDLSGTERLYKDEPLEATARRIREAVLAETRLSVSIGGGTSKLVAKMAATLAKPAGVHIVLAGDEATFMRRFVLGDIPFVGTRFVERLLRYNLKTVDDALAAGAESLRGWLGEREGSWLWEKIHGRDGGKVVRRAAAKSISRDETFAEDIDEDRRLGTELIRLIDRAAGDLREAGFLARTVSVRLRDFDFTDRQASRTLDEPVLSDQAVLRVGRTLLAKLRKARGVPARLLGVQLSNLVREEGPAQLSLLAAADGKDESERERAVARVVDRLRRKLGDDAVAIGRTPSRRRR